MQIARIAMFLAATHLLIACDLTETATAVQIQFESEAGMSEKWTEDALKVPADRSYLTETDSTFGGIFYFSKGKSARTHFDSSWRAQSLKRYGNTASVTIFSVPAATAGGAIEAPNPDSVAAIVRVQPPWYAFDFVVRKRMSDLLDEYSAIQNLHFKYFTIGLDNRVGGIYLWRDATAAASFYDAKWHEAIQQKYGMPASVEILSVGAVTTQ